MVEDDVLEVGGEMDLGGLDSREVVEGVGGQRAGAVLHRAGQPVCSRATLLSASSVSRSSFTSAMEPSGSTTPPWDVPVCTEILLMPASLPEGGKRSG